MHSTRLTLAEIELVSISDNIANIDQTTRREMQDCEKVPARTIFSITHSPEPVTNRFEMCY